MAETAPVLAPVTDAAKPAPTQADGKLTKPNFWRQLDIFTADTFNIPVHIIGVGATGSYIAETCAKMGIQTIVVYDFDTVDDHNIPNQYFGLSDFNKPKVEALAVKLEEATGIKLTTFNRKVNRIGGISGVVFLCVDSMDARKKLWDSCLKYNPEVELVVETRMGAEFGKIFCVNPNNPDHIEAWEATLFEDKESDEPVCTNRAINTTVKTLSGIAVHSIVCHRKKEAFPNETFLSMRPPLMYTKTWGVKEEKKPEAKARTKRK